MTRQVSTTKTSGPVGYDERDGMLIYWDVPIAMPDGVVLRADVFLPRTKGQYPAIMTYGPYAKGLSFQEGYPSAWTQMVQEFPEVERGSTGMYQTWEVVDPERWVPHGYACVRVDSRGAGRSPGRMECWSPQEAKDFYECIEWAGTQSWSNGKVGLNGISYYAMNQWQVASLKPPHLAAICAWEGAADFYRDVSHHGGIFCTFGITWYGKQVTTVQHGLGKRGPTSKVTRELVCGPVSLTDTELADNRSQLGEDYLAHQFDDDFFKARSAHWEEIEVPMLSAANWGGAGLHPRGNFEGFVRAKSPQKWLEVHGREHWTEFYTDYGVDLQKCFFDAFLKGEDNGWTKRSPVQLQIRHVDKFVERGEDAWPIPRTQWTTLYADATTMTLGRSVPERPAAVGYGGFSDGLTFLLTPSDHETEITGPLCAKLFVSSETEDADLFLVVRVFSPDLKEVVFQGALDPHTPIAQGWLRASHRKLDPGLSTPYRPYHTHDERLPLEPGQVYEVDVEIWPTSIVLPPGYRLGLTVRGKDYEYPGPATHLSNIANPMRGCGPFLHDEPRDRPPEIFGGRVTIHTGPDHPSSLLVPVIPSLQEKPT